jgi:hypothetical protein
VGRNWGGIGRNGEELWGDSGEIGEIGGEQGGGRKSSVISDQEPASFGVRPGRAALRSFASLRMTRS